MQNQKRKEKEVKAKNVSNDGRIYKKATCREQTKIFSSFC